MLTALQSCAPAQPAQDVVFQILNFDLSWLDQQSITGAVGANRVMTDFSPRPPRPTVTPIAIAAEQIDILWKLDRRSLEIMATNPCTPPAVLERLAGHPMADVRAAVGDNYNAPSHLIRSLVSDSDPQVRFQLAENYNTPADLLQILACDENPYVACRAQATSNRLASAGLRSIIGSQL